VRSQVDYAACYRALELQPRASLKEVEAKARFLRAAFHPDKFQGNLKDEATEKLKTINVALDELRAYWKTHGMALVASPKPREPQPQPPPKAETASGSGPNRRPEEQEPSPTRSSAYYTRSRPRQYRQSTQQNTQQPPQGAYQVYEDANLLSIRAGYPGIGSFQAKLLDPMWWKYLWQALGLPEGKLGRHEFQKGNEQVIIQAYGYHWEQLVCVFHIGRGISIDDYFRFFFSRNVTFWKDLNVRVVYLSEPPPASQSSVQRKGRR
jgi:curved DNA-binding protein CbpA